MTKRFLVLIVVWACLVLNLPHASAESWVIYRVPPPIGSLFVDFDSIVVEEYNPPKYVLTVTIGVNLGIDLACNKTTFRYNYDTKSISKYKFALPYSGWEETTWDRQIAADIWKYYYKMDFYEVNKEKFNSPVAQGDKFYADKNYPAAAKSYAEAREIDSIRLDELCKNLEKNGDKLDEQGQHLAALDYYKKAVTMNASGVNCSYELKRTYLKVKNFDDAILFYKAMTTGGYWYFWDDLAEIYYELKDYENAVKAYTSAISHYASTDYYNGRGKAYSALGQYERAIQDYDKAIQLNPNDDYAYNNRGNAYKNLGQYERAIQDYNKAIKLNPNNVLAYKNRALVYEQLKEYKKALKDYKKALKLDPNDEYAKQGIERVSKVK